MPLEGTRCVAAGRRGLTIGAIRTRRGSATWTTTSVYPTAGLVDVSCPTDLMCVAVDRRDVLTSLTLAGPRPAFTTIPIVRYSTLTGISCPSPSFCVAVDNAGRVTVGQAHEFRTERGQ
jgi:hypothetical protein